MTDGKWDDDTQTFHGGQEWKELGDRYVCDFSVTTNALGLPAGALTAAQEALVEAVHYPPADFEPALGKLAHWLATKNNDARAVHGCLQLGNGLSELIDLLTRQSPRGAFKAAGYTCGSDHYVQYKEYQRAAEADGRRILQPGDELGEGESVAITVVINPSNPSGDWKTLDQLMQFIDEECPKDSTVMIDESMLMWIGEDWREHSLLSRPDFLAAQLSKANRAVYVLHSWTKIWSCPGLRLGSAYCPSVERLKALKSQQVPWSLNVAALRFLEVVVDDEEYLQRTWKLTRDWREQTVQQITRHFPEWKIYGEDWLSWLWVDTGSEEVAASMIKKALAHGVPLRYGKYGYDCPTYLRFAVRDPKFQTTLFDALTR